MNFPFDNKRRLFYVMRW